VPLVFLMISHHYPVASYGNEYSWAILGGVFLLGWMIARKIMPH
jgi:uncharacterized membrane protein